MKHISLKVLSYWNLNFAIITSFATIDDLKYYHIGI